MKIVPVVAIDRAVIIVVGVLVSVVVVVLFLVSLVLRESIGSWKTEDERDQLYRHLVAAPKTIVLVVTRLRGSVERRLSLLSK